MPTWPGPPTPPVSCFYILLSYMYSCINYAKIINQVFVSIGIIHMYTSKSFQVEVSKGRVLAAVLRIGRAVFCNRKSAV